MIGKLILKNLFIVNCKSVVMLYIKILIEIKYVICCELKFKLVLINKGMVIVLVYIVNKCCNFKMVVFLFGVFVCCGVFNCFVFKIMYFFLKMLLFFYLMK